VNHRFFVLLFCAIALLLSSPLTQAKESTKGQKKSQKAKPQAIVTQKKKTQKKKSTNSSPQKVKPAAVKPAETPIRYEPLEDITPPRRKPPTTAKAIQGRKTTAYLNIEDGETVSVFNLEGMNWKVCSANTSCEPLAWPDNKSQIEIVGESKKVLTRDPYTGEDVLETYYPVRVKYERTADGMLYQKDLIGWIDASHVSLKKEDTFYGTSTTPAPPINPSPQICPNKDPKLGNCPLSEVTKAVENAAITNAADTLQDSVGQCAMKNPPKTKNDLSPNQMNYDLFALPLVNKAPLPIIEREDGKLMTRADLINIDAMARTLYAEIASCFKKGLHYPMTVARVMLNRVDNARYRTQFVDDPHSAKKPDLAKVATKPSQFQVWMNEHTYYVKDKNGKVLKDKNKKPIVDRTVVNPSLITALCPPRDEYQKLLTGKKPIPQEVSIWRNAVRIATEATLQPKRFKKRTVQVTQSHYSSNMDHFFGMSRKYPAIENRKIESGCVQVWD